MEEDLLKYFTGNGEPTTEEIKPININSGTIEGERIAYSYTMKTNDGAYFIKYGGLPLGPENTTMIEVYNVNSIKTGEPVLTFTDIKIDGKSFMISDMHQDTDGRFYALGFYWNNDLQTGANYLILFNNFIQDGEIKIRKYYTNTTMGFNVVFDNYGKIIKSNNNGYFILYYLGNNAIVYNYKIDINLGNTLESATITNSYSGTIFRIRNIYLINDTIIFPYVVQTEQYTYCTKLLIDTTNFQNGGNYTYELVKQVNYNSSLSIGVGRENNFNYYIPYLKPNGTKYNIEYQVIDLLGNTKTIIYNGQTYNNNTNLDIGFEENYVFITDGSSLKCLYNNNNDLYEVFTKDDFTYKFTNCKIIKQFNVDTIFSANYPSIYSDSTSYVKNIYSPGYSSIPYYNNNFMIPQYLNLYSNANDLTSLIFSRDVSNRFVAGNQLTAMFDIPNYLLNDETIHREIVNGQTNLPIEDNNKSYSKNRFESLYMTYMYNIYVKDNTNGNNLINQGGSNRIANSVWNILDYNNSKLSKVRITYEDGSQEILNLNITNITSNIKTFEYEVTGNINKIEYLSQDENTVYATYRCNLTGTNTISQTIQVSST